MSKTGKEAHRIMRRIAMACETLVRTPSSTRSSPYKALAEVGMTIATEAIISREQQALLTIRLKLWVR